MSFAREYPVKAIRKPRRCVGCGKMLIAGSPAVEWVGMSDGEFATATYHPDCREAEIALNNNAGGSWDEWYSLLNDRDTDDEAWLRTDFPSVAERIYGPSPPESS